MTIDVSKIPEIEKRILASRFLEAIKASTKDPQKKQQILDRMKKDGMKDGND